MHRSFLVWTTCVVLAAGGASPRGAACAAEGDQPVRTTLPQDHDYQRQLRAFMATLTEKDFEHGVTAALSEQPSSEDLEYQYRQFLYTLTIQPLVGTKRGVPSVNAPASLFLLPAIETPAGVMCPPVWPEALMSFVQWDYPGNPYHDNRALKLRAFVTGAIHLMMLDDHLTRHPEGGRADWYSYQLVYWGAGYSGFKDVLPPEVQTAYATGLRRMAERILEWGPRGEEPNFDMIAPVGLWYAAQAVGDPEFTARVEERARMMFTDPRYSHPAGYFVERGGVDIGFGGMTNYFVAWAALAGQWDFARDAVARVYRLRAHLDLPEPDGTWTGPSGFNARIGSRTRDDQWPWEGMRDYAASLVTDEAAYLVALPAAEALAGAGARRAGAFQGQINENPRITEDGTQRFIRNDEIRSSPWQWRIWATWNFPGSVNPGYEFYPEGAYAHRLELEQQGSSMLKSPFLRGETFVRDFSRAFTVTQQQTYAAILHTGPVGRQRPDDGLFQWAGPLGFGGGQIAAFWTPESGVVLQTRRRGMNWDKTIDLVEEWRTWPIHAVSGVTADGKVFTSGRILDPDVTSEINDLNATVTAKGAIPTDPIAMNQAAPGVIPYARTFQIDPDGVHVQTSVTGDGKEPIAEMYETLPVFLFETEQQRAAPTSIEFQADGQWAAATAEYGEKVTAIRLTRFTGSVVITFDQPRRVKLSPADWVDTYLSRAGCRNVLIDMLDGAAAPAPLDGERVVGYTISAAPAPAK